jgi:hypothetical protein
MLEDRMNKRMTFAALAVAALLAAALSGCDLFSPFSYMDNIGEWEFSNVSFHSASIGAVHLSVLGPESDARLDISWNGGLSFYMGD